MPQLKGFLISPWALAADFLPTASFPTAKHEAIALVIASNMIDLLSESFNFLANFLKPSMPSPLLRVLRITVLVYLFCF